MKINKNVFVFRSTFEYLKLLLKHVGLKKLSKIKEKIDLQSLIDFLCFHKKETEDLDHNMGFPSNESLDAADV